MIAATVDAQKDGTELVLGASCQRYEGVADLGRARVNSACELLTPIPWPGREEVDLIHFPMQACLDHEGRLTRAHLRVGEDMTSIELSSFGQAQIIKLPRSKRDRPR